MSDSAGRRRLSGAQIVVEYLVRQGVPVVAGIPGHGSWSLTDALLDRQDAIRTVQVMHEQSAVHLADGFYRATRPADPRLHQHRPRGHQHGRRDGHRLCRLDRRGAADRLAHTYMRGAGLLQELERRHVADNPRIFEPVVKEWWQPSRVDELPFVLHRAWNQMVSGRPGPILLDVPMDVLADSAEVALPDPAQREARGRIRPAADDVERAAALLRDAKRPVIVAGGGAITRRGLGRGHRPRRAARGAGRHDLERQGRHRRDARARRADRSATPASTSGNALAASADVILSVGNRFTDWSASSYRAGVTFAIPPTQLIQLDIDPREIGKNYPVEVGARRRREGGPRRPARGARPRRRPGGLPGHAVRRGDRASARRAWFEQVEVKSGSDAVPMTMARAVREIQRATRDDAIVVTGAGLPQGMVKQRWVTRRPRTHLTSRRVLDDGLRAAGGDRRAARAARRARSSSISGDGSFLQSMQELQTAVLAGTPVCAVVLDNSGWISIKGGQETFFGRSAWTDFRDAGRIALLPRLRRHRAGVRAPRRDASTDPAEVAPAVASRARVRAVRRWST